MYDAQGSLLIRRDPSGVKTLFLGGDTQVTYTPSGGSTTALRTFTFDDQVIAYRKANGYDGVVFQPPGFQGTSLVQTQGSGSSAGFAVRRFTPFGAPRGAANGTWELGRGFLGGTAAVAITDAGSGLVHLGAREYDPVLGRFLSVDPVIDLTDPTQWNAYAYAQNSPTTLSDPDGLRPLGAGDYGCNNCKMVYNTPAVKRPKSAYVPARKSSWVFGNDDDSRDSSGRYSAYGQPSVYGARYTGNHYAGAGNLPMEHYQPKPETLFSKVVEVAVSVTGPATILGLVDAGNQIADGNVQGGLIEGALSLPGLKYLKGAKAIGAAEDVGTAVKSARGGAGVVRIGQAGEQAVRAAYDIGPKATVQVGTRTRILDGLTDEAVTEVKNVANQAYTQQLKDSLEYATTTGRRFDLYVRPDTQLTAPLQRAVSEGSITLKFIP